MDLQLPEQEELALSLFDFGSRGIQSRQNPEYSPWALMQAACSRRKFSGIVNQLDCH